MPCLTPGRQPSRAAPTRRSSNSGWGGSTSGARATRAPWVSPPPSWTPAPNRGSTISASGDTLPHYVQLTPNYKVSRALVRHMNQLLGLRIPLDDLEKKGKGFRGGGHQGDLLQRRGQLLRQAAGEAVRRGIRSARAAHRGVGHRGCRGVPASGAARRWTLLLGQLTSPPGRLYHITLEAMEGRPAYTRLRLSPHRHTWDRPDVTLRPS